MSVHDMTALYKGQFLALIVNLLQEV